MRKRAPAVISRLRDEVKGRVADLLPPLASIDGLGPVALLFDEATDFSASAHVINVFAFIAGQMFFLAMEKTETHMNTDLLVTTITKVCVRACVSMCLCVRCVQSSVYMCVWVCVCLHT